MSFLSLTDSNVLKNNFVLRSIIFNQSTCGHCFFTRALHLRINLDNNYISYFTNERNFHLKYDQMLGLVEFSLRKNRITHMSNLFNEWNLAVNYIVKYLEMNNTLHYTFDFGSNPLICDCIAYEIYMNVKPYFLHFLLNLMPCTVLPLQI